MLFNFKFDLCQHAEARVAPTAEDVDVFEDCVGELGRVFQRRESSSSTCMRDQNASIIALS
jgi:hypothetical protein